jgi:hypothetical protein
MSVNSRGKETRVEYKKGQIAYFQSLKTSVNSASRENRYAKVNLF